MLRQVVLNLVNNAMDAIEGPGKVEIRTYPKGMLHAKAYLCWYKGHAEPGSAIVGSSNFTLAGFTGNTELNVRVTGDAEMTELGRWFDALWAESVDVTQDLAVELRRSWELARTSPYHVYLKALYELYKDELAAPELEPGKRGIPELANFQLDAVRRGLRMVEQHGGCFIGDVVGLGKTYIGAELVRSMPPCHNATTSSSRSTSAPAAKPAWTGRRWISRSRTASPTAAGVRPGDGPRITRTCPASWRSTRTAAWS